MRIVIDANIVLSALITRGRTWVLCLSDALDLIAPEFLFEECSGFMKEVQIKGCISEELLQELMNFLRSVIEVIPKDAFLHKLDEAEELTSDAKDREYLALALAEGCPVWSNDKALKSQTRVHVFSTKDIINLLEKSR